MRSLILGATGLIGNHVAAQCELRDDAVFGTWYRRPHSEHVPLDICDEVSVRAVVQDFQPDAVYVAAGMNQIDFAESHAEECHAVNVDGVRNVVRAIEDCDATLIYFSTAHVFNESKTAQKEDHAIDPANVHGRCAAAAEQTIREFLPDRHLILRSHWVYGTESRGKNPAAHALRRLRNRAPLCSAADRQCQPTYGPDLAAAAVELVRQQCRGTYHAVGSERMTEFAFYRTAAFVFGFDSDLVESTTAAELAEEAPRPRSPWLDRYKLRSQMGARAFRSVGEGLRAMRDQEQAPLVARAA